MKQTRSIEKVLTRRWTKMRLHQAQYDYYHSKARFNTVPAGRRSGKTEIAKRRVVRRALAQKKFPDARYICGGPTRDQAKRIYWNDIKALSPPRFVRRVEESALRITYVNGAFIDIVGFDKPERAEGDPIVGGVLDEYGNMKETVWTEHLRPSLTDRNGWLDFIGVPEGRNHYYDLDCYAIQNPTGEWMHHHWTTMDVLHLYIAENVDPDNLSDELRKLYDPTNPKKMRRLGQILAEREIAGARADLDDLSFNQEYCGSFVVFEGLAYYDFRREDHCEPCTKFYDDKKDLIFNFDFNVKPGTATVIQHMEYKGTNPDCADEVDAIIGEVYIPRNSNTPRVCRTLAKNWGNHRGDILCFGDATGGAKKSSQTEGTDWDLIEDYLRPVFGNRLIMMQEQSNPAERMRVNSLNSRIKAADGTIKLIVDGQKCPFTVKDFEGVTCGPDGSVEKDVDSMLTHLTDGIGYWAHSQHPLGSASISTESY